MSAQNCTSGSDQSMIPDTSLINRFVWLGGVSRLSIGHTRHLPRKYGRAGCAVGARERAAQVLIKHMSPTKATRFWASWQIGEGDYLVIREQLFEKETAKSLYKKIEQFQKKKTKNRQAS